MFELYSPLALLWCAFALLCGGVIKGALGVGTPLLTVPLMALVLPPRVAVAVMVIPVVAANCWQAAQAPRVGNVIGRFAPTFVAILIGAWIGVTIFARINEQALLLIVGVAVIIFALLQVSSRKLSIPRKLEKPAGVLFGIASGVIGGISSFFGPMLIIYLVSLQTLSKEEFIGSISFLYIGAVVPWAVALYFVGILDAQLLTLSSAAAAPVLIGMLLGRRLRRFVSEDRFAHLIAGVLVCSGAVIFWRGLSG